MAKVYKFENRDGNPPLTDQELMLLACFRQAPHEMQQRMLAVAMKRKKPEPGRSWPSAIRGARKRPPHG